MRVLVTGAGGQLGAALAPALDRHDRILLERSALDVTDAAAVEEAVRAHRPDAIVHAAAWTDVDGCERDPERARHLHVEGTRTVCAAARRALVIVVGTDYVFDGTLGRAYREADAPNPLQVYGATKLAAEEAALATGARVAVARTAWLYGARRLSGAPASNFARAVLDRAAEGPFDVVDDQVGSPTSTEDLARALVSVAEAGATGVLHAVNDGAISRFGFARAVLERAGMDPSLAHPILTHEAAPRPAQRPAYAPLEGARWREVGLEPLPPWDDALARVLPAILAAR